MLNNGMLLAATGMNSSISLIIWVVVLFAFMYFFMIRPQQKKQKEIQNFRKSIVKGQEIITAGGLLGVVRDIDEMNNILIVEISSGVRVRVDRNSVFAVGQAPTAN